MQGSPY